MSCDSDMFVLVNRRAAELRGAWRIEPADRAVAAPVDNVHPPAAGVLEDDDWRAGEIEFGDRGGDRKGFELFGPLRDDDRIEAIGGLFLFLARRLDEIIGDLDRARWPRSRAGVALEAGLVAAKPPFDLVGGLIEAGIGSCARPSACRLIPELRRNVQSER